MVLHAAIVIALPTPSCWNRLTCKQHQNKQQTKARWFRSNKRPISTILVTGTPATGVRTEDTIIMVGSCANTITNSPCGESATTVRTGWGLNPYCLSSVRPVRRYVGSRSPKTKSPRWRHGLFRDGHVWMLTGVDETRPRRHNQSTRPQERNELMVASGFVVCKFFLQIERTCAGGVRLAFSLAKKPVASMWCPAPPGKRSAAPPGATINLPWKGTRIQLSNYIHAPCPDYVRSRSAWSMH